MDVLLKIAMSQLEDMRTSELEHSKTIADFAQDIGVAWVDQDQTPKCSIFLNWCAKQAGLRGSKKLDIRSWLLTGWPTFNPGPGDAVVFWEDHPEGAKGHVGVFLGFSKRGNRVYNVSYSENANGGVSLMEHPTANVMGYQRLTYLSDPELPPEGIKKGDSGAMVKVLQNVLKMAGYECGPSDGYYGEKTEEAVRAVQLSFGMTMANGIYDEQVRQHLIIN